MSKNWKDIFFDEDAPENPTVDLPDANEEEGEDNGQGSEASGALSEDGNSEGITNEPMGEDQISGDKSTEFDDKLSFLNEGEGDDDSDEEEGDGDPEEKSEGDAEDCRGCGGRKKKSKKKSRRNSFSFLDEDAPGNPTVDLPDANEEEGEDNGQGSEASGALSEDGNSEGVTNEPMGEDQISGEKSTEFDDFFRALDAEEEGGDDDASESDESEGDGEEEEESSENKKRKSKKKSRRNSMSIFDDDDLGSSEEEDKEDDEETSEGAENKRKKSKKKSRRNEFSFLNEGDDGEGDDTEEEKDDDEEESGDDGEGDAENKKRKAKKKSRRNDFSFLNEGDGDDDDKEKDEPEKGDDEGSDDDGATEKEPAEGEPQKDAWSFFNEGIEEPENLPGNPSAPEPVDGNGNKICPDGNPDLPENLTEPVLQTVETENGDTTALQNRRHTSDRFFFI